MFYEVIPGRMLGKAADVLTYSFDSPLLPGQIVSIPIGKTSALGVVYKKVAQPNFPTKPIQKIIYSKPLPTHLLKTFQFLRDYYLISFAAAVPLLLPKGLDKNRRKSLADFAKPEQTPKLPIIPLNQAQKKALQALQEAQEATKLLHGVTGSGKTNIYLEEAKNALKHQQSTILLVPEIALTSQLVRVFEETFGRQVVLIHSRQTEAERHLIWENLLNAEAPNIIIGPRSALFAPVQNLGLIIIDECHESSYYQENSPKYSALRVASFIAKTLKISLIEGSATPTIVDYHLANTHNSLVTLTEKAKDTAVEPNIQIIDFKSRDNFTKNRYFSTQLINAITQNLTNHQQTLIFHNRRGSAPLTICEKCGEEILCPHCFLPLTLHSDSYELICHTCGYKQPVPKCCPKCSAPDIIHKGFGTKLLESELKKLFKTARVARFDADNTKNNSLDALYNEVKAGQIDIIIGTQTIAKGLDLPKLTTVGIVQADAGLSLPDYSAEERTYELINQVIGRVGRGHLDKAEVFIQTFHPESLVIQYAIQSNYTAFADYILKKRQTSNFPPYSYLAKLEITYKTERTTLTKIRQIYATLTKDPKLAVSTPTPAFHEHTDKGFTWQLVVRAKSRQHLIDTLKTLDSNNIHITIDPPSLL